MDADLGLLAKDRLFKGDRHLVAKIASALRARGTAIAAADIEHLAEKIAEDVADVLRAGEGAAIAADAAHPRVPVAVIGSALLRVGQHLVGFAALFEFLFGFGVARIAIGMKLHRQLAIGRLQLLVVRIAGYA